MRASSNSPKSTNSMKIKMKKKCLKMLALRMKCLIKGNKKINLAKVWRILIASLGELPLLKKEELVRLVGEIATSRLLAEYLWIWKQIRSSKTQKVQGNLSNRLGDSHKREKKMMKRKNKSKKLKILLIKVWSKSQINLKTAKNKK